MCGRGIWRLGRLPPHGQGPVLRVRRVQHLHSVRCFHATVAHVPCITNGKQHSTIGRCIHIHITLHSPIAIPMATDHYILVCREWHLSPEFLPCLPGLLPDAVHGG